MIILLAKFKVKAGKRAEVIERLREMNAHVLEKEDGCSMFEISTHCDDPDRIIIYEQYVDHAAIAAHRETEHFKRIIPNEIIPLLESRVIDFYEVAAS